MQVFDRPNKETGRNFKMTDAMAQMIIQTLNSLHKNEVQINDSVLIELQKENKLTNDEIFSAYVIWREMAGEKK